MAELQRIAQQNDMVLRNLLITDAYHRLALAVRERTGAGANWCTFATWASKQAGRTIRREDLAALLRARLASAPELSVLVQAGLPLLRDLGIEHSVGAFLDEIIRAIAANAAFDRAARSVAEGNLKVFEEIALQFAYFLAALSDNTADAFARFLAALRPGEAPAGQRVLRDAFAAYRAALDEHDDDARAERLFYANVLIGLHEQTRLQPQIAAALNAAFDQAEVKRDVVKALLPGFWRAVRYRIAALFGRRPPLDELLDELLPVVQRELRHVITTEVMTLNFPRGVVVRLGHDVIGAFPAALVTITNRALKELLQRIDPTPDSVKGSGARDWSQLSDRLHLIADLFRCHHESPTLFEPPFTTQQLEALYAGRRPLDPL